MHTMDAIDRSFSAGYEQGAKDYKEQRDLLLQENAELVGKIEQLTKERDALLDHCKKYPYCHFCKNFDEENEESENYGHTKECDDCGWYTWADYELPYKWEWRGIDE